MVIELNSHADASGVVFLGASCGEDCQDEESHADDACQ
jgi:hypothetical protein